MPVLLLYCAKHLAANRTSIGVLGGGDWLSMTKIVVPLKVIFAIKLLATKVTCERFFSVGAQVRQEMASILVPLCADGTVVIKCLFFGFFFGGGCFYFLLVDDALLSLVVDEDGCLLHCFLHILEVSLESVKRSIEELGSFLYEFRVIFVMLCSHMH